MTISELIKLLQSGLDPETEVTVWDPFFDTESDEVRLSITLDNKLHIGTSTFGKEIK